MKTPTMNKQEIAAEVLRRIKTYPSTHHQSYWFRPGEESDYDFGGAVSGHVLYATDIDFTDIEEWSDCGSKACVAGHTGAVGIEAGYRPGESETIEHFASYVLELDPEEQRFLFDPDIDTDVLEIALERIEKGLPLEIDEVDACTCMYGEEWCDDCY